MTHIRRASDVTAAKWRSGLGIGELNTLILAEQLGADLVLLDDLAARRLAQRRGFRVQGVIAVLEACFHKGYISDFRGAYIQLLSRGVFLNRTLLNGILQSLKLEAI